jgi:hypothetical protein
VLLPEGGEIILEKAVIEFGLLSERSGVLEGVHARLHDEDDTAESEDIESLRGEETLRLYFWGEVSLSANLQAGGALDDFSLLEPHRGAEVDELDVLIEVEANVLNLDVEVSEAFLLVHVRDRLGELPCVKACKIVAEPLHVFYHIV